MYTTCYTLFYYCGETAKRKPWVGDTKISTQVYNIFSRQDKKKIC